MFITVEFADAGTKSGSHRILTIGRGLEEMQSGDIGLSLEEAKTLIVTIRSRSKVQPCICQKRSTRCRNSVDKSKLSVATARPVGNVQATEGNRILPVGVLEPVYRDDYASFRPLEEHDGRTV